MNLANIFYKGPESAYFRLCRPYDVHCNYSTLPLSLKVDIGIHTFMNEFIHE